MTGVSAGDRRAPLRQFNRFAAPGRFNRARLSAHHHVSREELSVREHMSIILRKLGDAKVVEFAELFDAGQGVPLLVVTFIALLELTRGSLVELSQAENFAPIYVKLANAQSH